MEGKKDRFEPWEARDPTAFAADTKSDTASTVAVLSRPEKLWPKPLQVKSSQSDCSISFFGDLETLGFSKLLRPSQISKDYLGRFYFFTFVFVFWDHSASSSIIWLTFIVNTSDQEWDLKYKNKNEKINSSTFKSKKEFDL
jgi:hypothetical protein